MSGMAQAICAMLFWNCNPKMIVLTIVATKLWMSNTTT